MGGFFFFHHKRRVDSSVGWLKRWIKIVQDLQRSATLPPPAPRSYAFSLRNDRVDSYSLTNTPGFVELSYEREFFFSFFKLMIIRKWKKNI